MTSSPWIPVTECLPEEKELVPVTYVIRGEKKRTFGWLDGSRWTLALREGEDFDGALVVAWMSLPDPWDGVLVEGTTGC